MSFIDFIRELRKGNPDVKKAAKAMNTGSVRSSFVIENNEVEMGSTLLLTPFPPILTRLYCKTFTFDALTRILKEERRKNGFEK